MAVDSTFILNLAYCEYKAILYTVNRPKPRASIGRRIVRKLLLDLEPGDYEFREITIKRVVEGVEVTISPDIAVFQGEELTALLKARIRRNTRWSPIDFLQLGVAAALYEGVKRDPLLLVLVIAVSRESLMDAMKDIRSGSLRPARGDGWVITTRIHDEDEAWRIITRAVDLVRGTSQPRPNPSPAKCAACEYSRQCPYAITK